MEPQSSFMFLSICCETLGLKPEETLDSDYVLVASILREHNYILNERNKQMNGEDTEAEYKEVIDFNTGNTKRVRKVNGV